MVEFSVNIADEKEFKEFLQSSDLDYLTVVAMQQSVYFVSDSAELYTHISYEIVSRVNFKDNIVFRFQRQKLMSLLSTGILKFHIDSDNVVLKFQTAEGAPKYGYKCKYQTDLLTGFLRRLEILESAVDYARVNLGELMNLIRFAKSLNTTVRCAEGLACVELKSGTIYRKVDCTQFTCSGKLLYLLTRYTTEVYNVQNYLVYTSNNKAIIVTKNRDDFIPEVQFVEKAKSYYLSEFTLANVIDITKRIKFNDGKFVLDIDNSNAEYIEQDSVYDIAITVNNTVDLKYKTKEKDELDIGSLDLSDMLSGDSANTSLDTKVIGKRFPKILVPAEILKSVLVHMGVKSIVGINVKKNFVVLKIQGAFVVFGRKDYVG